MCLATIETSQVDILGRAVDSYADGLSPDVDRFIPQLKLEKNEDDR